MKLTPERARELRKQGFKVDPSKIIREVVEEASPDHGPPPQSHGPILQDHGPMLNYLAQAAKIAEQNTANVLELQFKQAEIIAELAKPKPKRKFVSTVTRDVRGGIKQVETQEV